MQDAAQGYQLESWFKQLAAVDILYIDDLGKGHWTQLTEAFWFDLVEARTSNCRPIIVTTNYKGDELEDRSRGDTAEYTIRRLREFCDVITLQ